MTSDDTTEAVESLAGLEQWHTGEPNDIYVLQGHQLRDWLARDRAQQRAEGGEKGWDDALNAIAWCVDNGAASAEAAFRYVAEHNPYRASRTAATEDDREEA